MSFRRQRRSKCAWLRAFAHRGGPTSVPRGPGWLSNSADPEPTRPEGRRSTTGAMTNNRGISRRQRPPEAGITCSVGGAEYLSQSGRVQPPETNTRPNGAAAPLRGRSRRAGGWSPRTRRWTDLPDDRAVSGRHQRRPARASLNVALPSQSCARARARRTLCDCHVWHRPSAREFGVVWGLLGYQPVRGGSAVRCWLVSSSSAPNPPGGVAHPGSLNDCPAAGVPPSPSPVHLGPSARPARSPLPRVLENRVAGAGPRLAHSPRWQRRGHHPGGGGFDRHPHTVRSKWAVAASSQ